METIITVATAMCAVSTNINIVKGVLMEPIRDPFVEEFFDSKIYKNILARNDAKGEYVVTTQSDATYLLVEADISVTELHFPEEIKQAITRVNS